MMSDITDVGLRLEALKIASATSYAVQAASGNKTIVEYAEEIYQYLKNGLQPTVIKDE